MRQHRVIVIFAAALLACVASSCGVKADMAFRADHSASLALAVEVPLAVEAKLRQFATAAPAPAAGSSVVVPAMFDAAAIAASVSARGFAIGESVAPSPRSWRGLFNSADLGKLLARDSELATVLAYARGPGWASIWLRVDRTNAVAIASLFPSLDGQLLEALQPPALYDNPVSAAEYRTMLSGLLGKAAVSALDGAAFVLSASFPGAIMESSGGIKIDAARKTATLSVPAIELMVLEQPVAFYIQWKE